jgi:NAD(P)-dependent dehydrogenase (short-subunit alcohol dehydrogenase family)
MREKKIGLVTGANRGIGKEIARQLDELGWQVIVTARTTAKAQEAARGLNSATAIVLDVADEASVSAAAKSIQSQFDSLDALINNAGVIGNSSALDFNLAQITSVMNTNFMGAIRTTKYMMPLLKNSKDARVINLSSGMGEWSSLRQGGYAAYRLSKTALNAFTVLLASEMRNTVVKVVSMCPGWVKTEMGGSGASRSVEKGAETAVWLATSSEIESGKFYRDKKVIPW